jgi:hypothetical protein
MSMRTSLYSILCIGIRLAAVLLAVRTLVGMPGIFVLPHGDWSTGEIWLMTILNVAVLLFAFLLWVFPGTLARLAAGKASQEVFESPIEGAELQYIAFSIVGLWLFFDAIVSLTYIGLHEVILRHYLRVQTGIDMSDKNAQSIASLVSNIVELVIGIALMLGARGLVAMLRGARYAGLPPTADGEEVVVEGGEKS